MRSSQLLWLLAVGVALSLCVGACSGDDGGGAQGDADGAGDGTSSADDTFGNSELASLDGGLEFMADENSAAVTGDDDGCGVGCTREATGVGTDNPFDLTTAESNNVGLDPDGNLVINTEQTNVPKFIWIANTNDRNNPGTVSKVDTTTLQEVARYAVGSRDPSRTSINIRGDAFVGSREGFGITKILVDGANCPDTNGDGMVTTSAGVGDVLAYDQASGVFQDDCIAWYTELPGDIRGVAAQDIPGRTTVEPQADAPPIVTTTEAEHYVWAGGIHGKIYKLDGETGQLLLTVDVPTAASGPGPTGVYGLALDGNGLLWFTGGGLADDHLGFIDTFQCVDDASCAVPACSLTCDEGACPASCDGAVKGAIVLAQNSNTYGITVDCQQRVWLGGHGDDIKRYDHYAPADARLRIADLATSGQDTSGVHGIAADAAGWVWGAVPDRGMVRIHAETLQAVLVPMNAPKGVAVDADGKIWAITLGTSAHVIEPGAGINDALVTSDAVTGFVQPYTYSDMTGQQLRLALNEPGYFRRLFEGCKDDGEPTAWLDLVYEAEVPDGTWVIFQARTADSLADLEDAEWFNVSAVPGGVSPTQITPFIKGADQEPGKYLEIEVRLFTDEAGGSSADGCTFTPATTPQVSNFAVSYRCTPEFG